MIISRSNVVSVGSTVKNTQNYRTTHNLDDTRRIPRFKAFHWEVIQWPLLETLNFACRVGS